MPLPEDPFTIEGGCNCGAVRYRVQVPALEKRPIYPGGGEDTSPPTRMPLVAADHCKDCRSATGALIPYWLPTPLDQVYASFVSRSSLPDVPGKLGKDVARGEWRPASEIFNPDRENAEDDFLSFFASSPNRSRSFCSRCGTMLAYQVFPVPDDWPAFMFPMLDIVLGTVDREYLEGVPLIPDMQLWWSRGIDWVRKLATSGMGDASKHPTFKVSETAKG